MKHHEVINTIRRLVRNAEFSQAQIAKATNLSGASISQYLNGKVFSDSVHSALESWLAAVGIFSWIPTPTSSTIMTALEYTHTTHEMSLIVGHAGVGKTYTAMEFVHRNPTVKYRYLNIFDNSKNALLYTIAETFGVRVTPNNRVLYARLLQALCECRSPMLILDEAQHLPIPCLELVRALHDQAGLAVVFMGNEIVYRRLSGGSKAADFAQLVSRIGHKVMVTEPTLADTTELHKALSKQMTFSGAVVPLLHKIARSPGAFRNVQKTLSLARTMAPEITPEVLMLAYTSATGDNWVSLAEEAP